MSEDRLRLLFGPSSAPVVLMGPGGLFFAGVVLWVRRPTPALAS